MSDKRPAPFKVLWERALMRRSKLPLPCIAVLAALASYANADGGSIHPSQARLADDLGVTVRTVGKWIRHGLDTGWIAETRRGFGYGEISRPSLYLLKIPDAIGGNQKQASGSATDQHKKECSDSTGEPLQTPKASSGSVWDLAEKATVRDSEPERSGVTVGTLVQQNRQDASDYQVNTKSSSTQIPSELNYLPSGEPNPEPEVAPDEWVAGEPELGYFAAKHARMQALREAAAEKPIRYGSRYAG